MAKMACLSGAVVGKIGGNVYSVNSGQQIVRAYQPNVTNPSTEQQVATRAKFKLASQLAAAFSPVLAISKNGMVSGRNQFVSETMKHISISSGESEANVQLSALQLTKSSIPLPGLSVAVSDSVVRAQLADSALVLGVSKVIYAKFVATNVNQLRLQVATVVTNPGANGQFAADLGAAGSYPTFVYAYGIIEDENNMLAKYGDFSVDGATAIASLISSRSSAASGLKTTSTRYAIPSNALNSAAKPSDGESSSSRGAARGK